MNERRAKAEAMHPDDVLALMDERDSLRQRLTTAEHTAALYMGDVSVLMACVKESCEILGVTEDSEDDWPKLPTFIQGLVADRDRYRLAATMEAARTRNECKLALNRLRRRVGEKLPANLAIGALDGVGGDPVVEHVAIEVIG
jgi:hypothetical protein